MTYTLQFPSRELRDAQAAKLREKNHVHKGTGYLDGKMVWEVRWSPRR